MSSVIATLLFLLFPQHALPPVISVFEGDDSVRLIELLDRAKPAELDALLRPVGAVAGDPQATYACEMYYLQSTPPSHRLEVDNHDAFDLQGEYFLFDLDSCQDVPKALALGMFNPEICAEGYRNCTLAECKPELIGGKYAARYKCGQFFRSGAIVDVPKPAPPSPRPDWNDPSCQERRRYETCMQGWPSPRDSLGEYDDYARGIGPSTCENIPILGREEAAWTYWENFNGLCGKRTCIRTSCTHDDEYGPPSGDLHYLRIDWHCGEPDLASVPPPCEVFAEPELAW